MRMGDLVQSIDKVFINPVKGICYIRKKVFLNCTCGVTAIMKLFHCIDFSTRLL